MEMLEFAGGGRGALRSLLSVLWRGLGCGSGWFRRHFWGPKRLGFLDFGENWHCTTQPNLATRGKGARLDMKSRRVRTHQEDAARRGEQRGEGRRADMT